MASIDAELNALDDAVRVCRRCRLCESRLHALCGEGDRRAKLMLIAQAPGTREDREGSMFIGPSGRVLDELLKDAGIDRETLYMTNLVKCMLPKNRNPKRDEIAACTPYLDREIELVDPAVIAPLGYYAIRHILEKYGIPVPPRAEFRTLFGTAFAAGGRTIIPLQHPAVVLYNASYRQSLIENYRKLGGML
jgi:DNA polymerase